MKKIKHQMTQVEKDEVKFNSYFNPDPKKYIRPPKLNLSHKVYLTQEAYDVLRSEKREQEQSMAQLVCDLIMKEYNK